MAAERIRILYIAHYFPPLGGVAALRSLKMVKYLSEHGIDCIVLTAKPLGLRDPKDKELLREIPARTVIRRYWVPEITWLYKALWGLKLHKLVDWISQNLITPDNMILALPFAWYAVNKIMGRSRKPVLAVISGGPFSLMTLGPKLKAKYHLPYICDWRDEWTNNAQRINRDYPPGVLAKERLQEAQILSNASAIVYLTQRMRDNFRALQPQIIDSPFRIIPNGYDEADFKGFQAQKHGAGKLRILYTGSFYDRIQPDNLWRSISELINEHIIDPSKLEIIIMGNNNKPFVLGTYIDDDVIQSIVQFLPFTPHRECIRQMQFTDLLLIYIPSGSNSQSILTGKLFDYLRSGKPILTIAPIDGLAAELVSQAGTGFVADYADIEDIKTQIQKLWAMWIDGTLQEIKANETYINQFARQQQASVLSGLIKETMNA